MPSARLCHSQVQLSFSCCCSGDFNWPPQSYFKNTRQVRAAWRGNKIPSDWWEHFLCAFRQSRSAEKRPAAFRRSCAYGAARHFSPQCAVSVVGKLSCRYFDDLKLLASVRQSIDRSHRFRKRSLRPGIIAWLPKIGCGNWCAFITMYGFIISFCFCNIDGLVSNVVSAGRASIAQQKFFKIH